MKTSSLRIAVMAMIITPPLFFRPTAASAATVTVTVGNGGFFFTPSSVTIHPGDTVLWTWSSTGHSSTSGNPGMPTGLWDSGILNQGATFTHTFNTAGSFPYYCTPHGACCNMVGMVTVVNRGKPTPTPDPHSYAECHSYSHIDSHPGAHIHSWFHALNHATDFNSDGHPDYLLFNANTLHTVFGT